MPTHPATRWITLAAIVALLAGLGIAVRQWRTQPPPSATTTMPPAPDDTSDGVIERALSQIPTPIDSAEIKARWQDEVAALDYADLTLERREIFLRFANAQRCTCGCGFTLAGCRASDMSCDVSRERVEALLDSVRRGFIRSARGVRERPSRPS